MQFVLRQLADTVRCARATCCSADSMAATHLRSSLRNRGCTRAVLAATTARLSQHTHRQHFTRCCAVVQRPTECRVGHGLPVLGRGVANVGVSSFCSLPRAGLHAGSGVTAPRHATVCPPSTVLCPHHRAASSSAQTPKPGTQSHGSDASPITAGAFAECMDRLPAEAKAVLSQPQTRVAVAVSGGPDSLALTALLRDWCKVHNVKLVALTVNHAIREESADEIKVLGRQLELLGVDYEVLTVDWGEKGVPKPGKLQHAARDRRYGLLQDACERLGVRYVEWPTATRTRAY